MKVTIDVPDGMAVLLVSVTSLRNIAAPLDPLVPIMEQSQAAQPQRVPQVLGTDILIIAMLSNITISAPARNRIEELAVRKHGCITVADFVANVTVKQLRSIKGVGDATICALLSWLDVMGLKLKP